MDLLTHAHTTCTHTNTPHAYIPHTCTHTHTMPSKEPQWISSSSEVSPKVTESLEVPVGGPEQESGRGLWAGATNVLGKAHPALASSAREKTS